MCIRDSGDLEPSTLAVMHGSSYRGDGKRALYELADAYEEITRAVLEPAAGVASQAG